MASSQIQNYGMENNEIDDAIVDLIAAAGGSRHSDIIKELIITALKLAQQDAGRGDLKIANTALKEMRYAFKIFDPYRHVRKVSIFGSARTKPDQVAYQQAYEFAEEITKRGYMVITGAGPGIMEAGSGGAGRERSFGVNIRLPFEQNANQHIDEDPKLIHFKYFFTRKLFFLKETAAIALFPGGFGTQDEAYESLTLIQTGKSVLLPVVAVDPPGGTYWASWLDWIKSELLGGGNISEDDLNLIYHTTSVEDACSHIENFYRVFHSSRFVRGTMVFRLNEALTDGAVEKINDEFGSILKSGKFTQGPSFPDEANEPEIRHLPRLSFDFDMHAYGRMRKLIDVINESETRSPFEGDLPGTPHS